MVLILIVVFVQMNPVLLHFRPLAGIMVLIRTDEDVYSTLVHEISVPLRGLWFLSCLLQHMNGYDGCFDFRPLAGIMVLIL